MILNLKFKNYRSFKDECVFTMEPTRSVAKTNNLSEVNIIGKGITRILKISAIFGANASGKTNIIKFLYRFQRWIYNEGNSVGQPILLYNPFKFDKDSASQPCSFAIEFIVGEIRYSYEIEFGNFAILSEELNYFPNGRITLLYKRGMQKESNFHHIIPGSSVKVHQLQVFPNQLLLSKFLIDTPYEGITIAAKYLAEISISNGFHEDWLANRLPDYLGWLRRDSQRGNKLRQFLRYTDTGLYGFDSIMKDSKNYDLKGLHLRYDKGEMVGKDDLPFIEESFGTRSLFMLGCSILRSLENGSPIFVDEIDSGLHTNIIKLIVNMFRNEYINKNKSQLIFTTHNVILLDQDEIRKDQIWFVEKDKYGCSELYSLSDFEDVRETTPFTKWYLDNKFGGVPILKSLEQLFTEEDAEN